MRISYIRLTPFNFILFFMKIIIYINKDDEVGIEVR